MFRSDDAYSLAALFHMNSEPWGNSEAYRDPHGRVMEFKTLSGTPAIRLPPSVSSPLSDLMAARRSCRDFDARPISLPQLAALLDAAYGVTGLYSWGGGERIFTRAVPSGGARYPLELYVLCSRVAELSAGIHHFNARDRTLRPVAGPCAIADLSADLLHQDYLQQAAALVIMVAVFPRMLGKYGARGYRYTLIECGHAAQNLCLRAVEMGLATLCVGGFVDHRVNGLLGLDFRTEGALYAVAIGWPPQREYVGVSEQYAIRQRETRLQCGDGSRPGAHP